MAWQVKISDNATVKDTVNLIRNTVNKYAHSPFVAELTAKLKAESPTTESFLKNLFNYACKNVQYERDPSGHEKVTTPEALIRIGKGDCKKFSVLIAAVLKKAGFKPVLKIVSYDNQSWAHIYVILPVKGERKYITLDPVNKCQYDKEVSHKKGWLHSLKGENMELSLLGRANGQETGITKPMFSNLRNDPKFMSMCAHQCRKYRGLRKRGLVTPTLSGAAGDMLNDLSEVSGAGIDELIYGESFNNSLEGLSGPEEAVMKELLGLANNSLAGEEMLFGMYGEDDLGKQKKGARKKRKGKVWGFLKKIGLAPSRIAFLAMVRINLFGLAKKLYQSYMKDKGKRLSKLWKKLGGNPKKLWKTISKGVARLKKKGKLKGLAEYDSYLQSVGAAPLVAVLAAAVPIVTAVVGLFKKQGVVSKDNPEDVALVKNADNAEKQLEQKIDSGEADKIVSQVQTDSRLQQDLATQAQQNSGGEVAESYESDQAKAMDLSGLGAVDWGNLFKTVSSVVKAVKPAVKPAVEAVRKIKAASQKATNPKTKAYLATKANQATTALQKATKGTPAEKASAGKQVVEILNDVADTVESSLKKETTPSYGGYSGGNIYEKLLKIGVGVGYVQTFYGEKIMNFLTNLF